MECNRMLAQELLSVPKLIIDNDKIQESYFIKFGTGIIGIRLNMCSLDKKWKFLIDVNQNKMRATKINIHFQESCNYIQLYRIDYNAPNHTNPKVASKYVPEILVPYVGKTISENHVHIFVQGEKTLVWAIPLSDYDFPVKTLSNMKDLRYALTEFFCLINLETVCEFEGRFIL